MITSEIVSKQLQRIVEEFLFVSLSDDHTFSNAWLVRPGEEARRDDYVLTINFGSSSLER